MLRGMARYAAWLVALAGLGVSTPGAAASAVEKACGAGNPGRPSRACVEASMADARKALKKGDTTTAVNLVIGRSDGWGYCTHLAGFAPWAPPPAPADVDRDAPVLAEAYRHPDLAEPARRLFRDACEARTVAREASDREVADLREALSGPDAAARIDAILHALRGRAPSLALRAEVLAAIGPHLDAYLAEDVPAATLRVLVMLGRPDLEDRLRARLAADDRRDLAKVTTVAVDEENLGRLLRTRDGLPDAARADADAHLAASFAALVDRIEAAPDPVERVRRLAGLARQVPPQLDDPLLGPMTTRLRSGVDAALAEASAAARSGASPRLGAALRLRPALTAAKAATPEDRADPWRPAVGPLLGVMAETQAALRAEADRAAAHPGRQALYRAAADQLAVAGAIRRDIAAELRGPVTVAPAKALDCGVRLPTDLGRAPVPGVALAATLTVERCALSGALVERSRREETVYETTTSRGPCIDRGDVGGCNQYGTTQATTAREVTVVEEAWVTTGVLRGTVALSWPGGGRTVPVALETSVDEDRLCQHGARGCDGPGTVTRALAGELAKAMAAAVADPVTVAGLRAAAAGLVAEGDAARATDPALALDRFVQAHAAGVPLGAERRAWIARQLGIAEADLPLLLPEG